MLFPTFYFNLFAGVTAGWHGRNKTVFQREFCRKMPEKQSVGLQIANRSLPNDS
jgi:hypothetical protein